MIILFNHKFLASINLELSTKLMEIKNLDVLFGLFWKPINLKRLRNRKSLKIRWEKNITQSLILMFPCLIKTEYLINYICMFVNTVFLCFVTWHWMLSFLFFVFFKDHWIFALYITHSCLSIYHFLFLATHGCSHPCFIFLHNFTTTPNIAAS